MPQHGTPVGTTSSAHLATRASNWDSSLSFFEEHGTWMATVPFCFSKSTLSPRNAETNSTGSYMANLRMGSLMWSFMCLRQGEVSQTMGCLPWSEAASSLASSSSILALDASTQPRLWNIMPQHCERTWSGYTTSIPALLMSERKASGTDCWTGSEAVGPMTRVTHAGTYTTLLAKTPRCVGALDVVGAGKGGSALAPAGRAGFHCGTSPPPNLWATPATAPTTVVPRARCATETAESSGGVRRSK
mmetsp:Transcript_6483/g.19693  ORF Transcript_6483/g.19693 Transcript_6483/m.19693 type:complete len:246 (+) Transcript_6483:362-1099(+)